MTIRIYGDRLTPGTVGPRQVPQVPVAKNEPPPIQVNRWVRNNQHPNAEFESLKNEQLNYGALFRTKDYCAFIGSLNAPQAPGTPEDRWRFAFRSGPFAHAAMCCAVIGAPGPSWTGTNTYVNLKLFSDTAEAVLVSQTQFNYGVKYGGTSPQGWKYIRTIEKLIDITPNTDYYALIQNVDGARVLGFVMFELASLTENFSGYLPQNISAHNPILDLYRQNESRMLVTAWPDYGPKVFNWSTDPGNTYSSGMGGAPNFTYKTRSSSTPVNILDLTSTTVTVNTPGYKPDMTLKNRASQSSGVPMVMKAFAKTSAGANGDVILKDSGGTAIATISGGWSTTPGWKSVTFNMPALSAKYDPHFASDGINTFSLWAVSIYEKG